MAKRQTKRETVDLINERYMRIQEDLTYILRNLKKLDFKARHAFMREISDTLGTLIRDGFGGVDNDKKVI